MRMQNWKSAIVLARTLHFTEAANELNIVQPALSQQIKLLEEELGAKLFERSKRKVVLTQAGHYFTNEIEKVLQIIDQITMRTQQIHAGDLGEIRIGFTHSVLQTILMEVVQHIHTLRTQVRTVLKEINNNGQYEALERMELDIGFATNPIIPPDLCGKVLHRANFVVLLPPHHQLNQRNYGHFGEFREESFIFPFKADGHNYYRTLESICMDSGFYPKIAHITSSATTCFKLVEAGVGICIEPKTSLYRVRSPLSVIELSEITQKAELTMMWRPDFEEEYPEIIALLQDNNAYSYI